MSKKIHKPMIYAYGFDKLGFMTTNSPVEEKEFILKFLDFSEEASLDEADGLIIPSGIFEHIFTPRNFYGTSEPQVQYDPHLLAAREKQLYNAFKRGAWTAFLLQAVNNGGYQDWTGTDLAKKFLNIFATDVRLHKPNAYVTSKADEFRKYIEKFGIAQTSFSTKDSMGTARILAQANETPVGLEVRGQFFFLPFHTVKQDEKEIIQAASLISMSVFEYKRKNDIYFPPWIDSLRFKSEVHIQEEIQKSEERLVKLGEEAERWKRYKAILCTSGQNLNVVTVAVLRDFFGLNLKNEEQYIEDAIIFSDAGETKFVVEIKGINGGIKRDHINQVDSHRERLGIDPKIPGLLIVNDFMDVEDFDIRKAKKFDANNLAHANKINVKVLRTATLFEYMLALEENEDRKTAFSNFCDRANPLVEISAK